MRVSRNWQSIALGLLLTTSAWGQTTPEAAQEKLGKIVATSSNWVFQRTWQTQASCDELHAMVEKALNLVMRQATKGMPVAPPKVQIDHFVLMRHAKGVQVTVKLKGLPEALKRSTEVKSNTWIATSPQGGVLRALLLQPLAIPTFGNGGVLKGATCEIAEETPASLSVTVTPGVVTQIFGRPTKNFLVRIDKEKEVIRTIKADFTDGSMLEASFTHSEVKARDETSFLMPATVALRHRGLAALGQGIRLPTICMLKYGKWRVGKELGK